MADIVSRSVKPLKKDEKKVQEALDSLGVDAKVVKLDVTARTAQDAANALECEVGQIGKSLVFKKIESDEPVLIIASGVNRVNERSVGKIIGAEIEIGDANFALKTTGYTIGGIPPLGHKKKISTYVDEDLMKFGTIWVAAGTTHAVFEIDPKKLVEVVEGMIISVE